MRSHPTRRPHSGDALTARRSAQVRGARLALRVAPRARRVYIAARANLNTHTVASGENLWAISVARGVTLQELKAANAKALGRGDTIYPGQQLIVPAGGKRFASVPSGYKPSASTGVGAYKSAGNAGALRASVNPANLAKKQGLGLVTAGAFFIALAAGIWMFKEEEPPGRGGAPGAYDQRDMSYGGLDQGGGFDQGGGYTNGQGGYYDQYNQGDWPQQPGNGFGDARASPRGGDYSGPPQWGEVQRY